MKSEQRGSPMTAGWLRCPHCNVFLTPPGQRAPAACPACGKALKAAPAPGPGSPGPVHAPCAFGSWHHQLSEAMVVPEAANCVQCGMCSFNCPMGIDVRAHAWRGLPVHDSHCLTCSECVRRCPRGVLRFERIPLVAG
jgi:NAD-dependent dihydropyrimidine dehydrogenase PreA subunit